MNQDNGGSSLPDLARIQTEVERLAPIIDAPARELPTYGYSQDFAYPHLEVWNGALWWVVVERGKELERRSTTDLNELLYWVFEGVTFSMASDWELRNRVEDQDFRILLFTKQFELLAMLDPRWPDRRKKELGPNILRETGLA